MFYNARLDLRHWEVDYASDEYVSWIELCVFLLAPDAILSEYDGSGRIYSLLYEVCSSRKSLCRYHDVVEWSVFERLSHSLHSSRPVGGVAKYL